MFYLKLQRSRKSEWMSDGQYSKIKYKDRALHTWQSPLPYALRAAVVRKRICKSCQVSSYCPICSLNRVLQIRVRLKGEHISAWVSDIQSVWCRKQPVNKSESDSWDYTGRRTIKPVFIMSAVNPGTTRKTMAHDIAQCIPSQQPALPNPQRKISGEMYSARYGGWW